MKAGKRKLKVTGEEFAKVLFGWLLTNLSTESIQHTADTMIVGEEERKAKLFGFDLDNGLHPYGWTEKVRKIRQVTPNSVRLSSAVPQN